MNEPCRKRVVCFIAGLVLLGGCKTPSSTSSAALASASAPSAVASTGPSVPRTKPWFSGGFSGQYEAKVAVVDIKTGAVREWSRDDGKQFSGLGKLTLRISDDGIASGSSEGSLGTSTAHGKVEDDTLRVQLTPTDETGLGGVLLASRDGDGFKGTIAASTGDSLRVRQATIELKKQAD